MWKTVCETLDNYLERAGDPQPSEFNADEYTVRYARAIQIHEQQVRFYHPSARKRRNRRNGDVAKKVSTIHGELKAMEKFKEKLLRHNEVFTRLQALARGYLERKNRSSNQIA